MSYAQLSCCGSSLGLEPGELVQHEAECKAAGWLWMPSAYPEDPCREPPPAGGYKPQPSSSSSALPYVFGAGAVVAGAWLLSRSR